MSPHLVVFDLAGTTVDGADYVPHFLQKVLRTYGIEIPFKDINERMGLPKPLAIRELLTLHADANRITDIWIEKVHHLFVQDMVHFYQNSSDVKEKEGASELFALLKSKDIYVVVDTGFDRQITDAIIKRLQWSEKKRIDYSVTSDEVTHGRPFPDMIFRAMQLTGVENSSFVAKVGDTASDMQQGHAAGCKWVVGVTTGAYTAEDLHKEPHTHLIATLSELRSIFSLS